MDAEADYYPETVEDLAIVYPDERLELVQIKSVSDPFALSVLAPGKEDSFFEHVKHFYDLGLRVVSLKLLCSGVWAQKCLVLFLAMKMPLRASRLS